LRTSFLVIASFLCFFCFRPADSAATTYPQIDINGYKKYQSTTLNVEPRFLFQAQSILGGYYGGGPWQESLKLNIIGKLNERLSVSYDLEQLPDTPERFDVKVTYDKTELTFGDFQANFTKNEFASTSKSLNGVMLTSRDTWYDLLFVPSAKLKSQTQGLVTQRGNNSKGPYNLGHGSIIEDSERVELNNVLLNRGTDYTIDYFSGKIIFSRILSPDDEFKYSYEFTNLMDLFFPTVSKRDFVGIESSFIVDPTLLGEPVKKRERAIKSGSETFPTLMEVLKKETTKEVITLPPHVSVETGIESFIIRLNGLPVITVHNISGEVPASTKADTIKNRLEAALEYGITTSEISTSTLNGEEIVMAGSRSIATASWKEAQFYNISNRDLANKWKNDVITALSSREIIERIISPEAEEYEWESTGSYKLKNAPIIPYSEKLTFMGTQLKKFEDYLINYLEGTITLLRPNLPTAMEPLSVEYQYVDVAGESETLPGAGKGPYDLAHEDIIEGSENVYINNIPYVRELDYKIDYKLGKMMFFSNIPRTANIIIRYKYLAMTTPPPPVTPVTPRALNLGFSYLKESGRSGATPPSIAVTENKSGKDIINNNNTIYLNFRPVTSTGEVEIFRNDVLQQYGIDYAFPIFLPDGTLTPDAKLAYRCDRSDLSDGLTTGTIKFLGPLEATDEVTISYNYSKWSSDRFTDHGTGSTLKYYLGSFRNIVPGVEEVQIWRRNVLNPIVKRLTRNSSVETFDGQYYINYSNPPSITFNTDPIIVDGEMFYLNDIDFTVIFKFIAQASVSERPLEHDVLGLNFAGKIGDNLSLSGSYARSKTDQVYATMSTSESFNGDNVSKRWGLHSLGQIVDGSEQVYLNGQKLNSDDHYAFSYDAPGTLTFFIITPSTQDVISIDYSYQDLNAPATKLSEKHGSAYSFSGGIKPFPNLELAGDFKKIDYNFSPMGGTSIPLGSDYRHGYTKITPLPSIVPSFWMSGDLKESNVPIGNRQDKFLNSSDKNFASGINPFGLAQIDFGFRDYSTMDDLLPGSNVHTYDYQSLAYSLSIAPRSLSYGEFAWTNRNDFRRSLSYTDTKDLLQPKDSKIDYYHTNNSFGLTRRFNFSVDYQENQPSTISYESYTRAPSRGRTTDRSKTIDKGYYLNGDLTFWLLKKLSAYANRLEHEENIELPSRTRRATLNETYHFDMIPIDQISLGYDQNRQEVPTVTTAIGNPKTERRAANVNFNPYSGTSFGWSGSEDNSLQEGGYRTSGNANNYSVSHTLLSGQNYKLNTNFSLSQSLRRAPVGTTEVATDSRGYSQSYNITFNPATIWSINSGFLQEDYSNRNDAPTSPLDTKSQSQTISMGTLYKATSDLDLSGNYSVKVTGTLKPQQLTAHKAMMDAHAIYKIFTYGTFNVDWSREENGGEILGGSFVSQDYIKTISALSITFVIPENEQQVVLSSIVLNAAVKFLDFTDRATPDNSFPATLITFDGTLNF